MITGDKPNTAISIGRSTGIIDPQTPDRAILLLDRTAELRDAQAVLARLAEWTRDVDAHRSALSSPRLTRSDAAVRALRDRKHVLFHHLHAAVQRVSRFPHRRARRARHARALRHFLPRLPQAESTPRGELLNSPKWCC